MPKWLLVVLLLLGAHFGASYLVPLQRGDQGLFGGLLRWVWPWSVGDRGFLGELDGIAMPMTGFVLAVGAAAALLLAVMSLLGWLIPPGWWRALVGIGGGLLLLASVGFLGVTKLLPVLLAALLLAAAFGRVALMR